jgi:hypothetical protein
MSELIPLLASSADDFELALLRSTEEDALGEDALLRTATALGLGAGVLLQLTQASPVTLPASPTSWWPLVSKWLGVGALSGFAISGAAIVATNPAQSVTALTARSRPVPANASSEGQSEIVTNRATEPEAKPIARRRERTPVTGVARGELASPKPELAIPALSSDGAFAPLAASTPPIANSIAEQIRAIELARQALVEKRPASAFRAVEDYRLRWPNGALIPEAVVLGVRAKKLLGDEQGAERDASVFIAHNPNSRYSAQLRALLGITGNP